MVRKMIVAGDYVTVHMDFRGHFTGVFGKTKGQGQAILATRRQHEIVMLARERVGELLTQPARGSSN